MQNAKKKMLWITEALEFYLNYERNESPELAMNENYDLEENCANFLLMNKLMSLISERQL